MEATKQTSIVVAVVWKSADTDSVAASTMTAQTRGCAKEQQESVGFATAA